jgi:NAD+ kinase
VSDDRTPERVALVVHPTRALSSALGTLRQWAAEHGIDVVQLSADGPPGQEVAELGRLRTGDLVVALGGDGTALSALRAAAAVKAPVLGVACGSLGVLTAVSADDLATALDRVRSGDWTARSLPALAIDAANGTDDWAVNDFVVVRQGSGQVVAEVAVNDELYVRLAGDGLIVATPAGSSGYSMAAGGPLLPVHTPAYVCTPLAMHGGSAPPLVVQADATLTVEVHPSYAGFDIEIDGHRRPVAARAFRLTLEENKVRLVTFAPSDQGLRWLRQRGVIADSPRVLARDRRAAYESVGNPLG